MNTNPVSFSGHVKFNAIESLFGVIAKKVPSTVDPKNVRKITPSTIDGGYCCRVYDSEISDKFTRCKVPDGYSTNKFIEIFNYALDTMKNKAGILDLTDANVLTKISEKMKVDNANLLK
ncbi:MAG: hypothetical protein PHV68_05065 [Candidatus Gastranaerophilales bacterium]|nr:hypothetical protein [Candidatus Gastranaerophilales bacterium]